MKRTYCDICGKEFAGRRNTTADIMALMTAGKIYDICEECLNSVEHCVDLDRRVRQMVADLVGEVQNED
jgi:hypothetical protein